MFTIILSKFIPEGPQNKFIPFLIASDVLQFRVFSEFPRYGVIVVCSNSANSFLIQMEEESQALCFMSNFSDVIKSRDSSFSDGPVPIGLPEGAKIVAE